MKEMTCKQLGGACEEVFRAETFDEMAKLSAMHGMSMKEDPMHQEAMMAMRELMQNPEAMGQWMAEKKKLFDETSEC